LPSEKPARRLEDIIDNAQAIQRYIAGMDLDAFEKDSKTYDAVERCLERISEAAVKLGDMAPSLIPKAARGTTFVTHHNPKPFTKGDSSHPAPPAREAR
jgi:hypothetical protein